MKVWILSSGINGPVEDWSVTDILKGDGLKVYASRHGAEAALDTLLLAAFDGDWQIVVNDDGCVIAEGTLLVPMGRCTTGWAGIAVQDVIEDEPQMPAVGDAAIMHVKPTNTAYLGWRVSRSDGLLMQVDVTEGTAHKRLGYAKGCWRLNDDVHFTFEPPPKP